MNTIEFLKEATTVPSGGKSIPYLPVKSMDFKNIKLDVSGDGVISLQVEILMGGRWAVSNVIRLSNYDITDAITVNNERYEADVAGGNGVRISVTSISGGDVTVIGRIY